MSECVWVSEWVSACVGASVVVLSEAVSFACHTLKALMRSATSIVDLWYCDDSLMLYRRVCRCDSRVSDIRHRFQVVCETAAECRCSSCKFNGNVVFVIVSAIWWCLRFTIHDSRVLVFPMLTRLERSIRRKAVAVLFYVIHLSCVWKCTRALHRSWTDVMRNRAHYIGPGLM